jgi:hypothetical protein
MLRKRTESMWRERFRALERRITLSTGARCCKRRSWSGEGRYLMHSRSEKETHVAQMELCRVYSNAQM